MRFVVLMDPDDEARWSGAPTRLVQALRDAGHEALTIAPPGEPLWHRAKRRFYRKVLRRIYMVDRAPGVLRARARNASRALAGLADVAAVLATHPPDAAYLDCRAPVMVVHDATWYQLLGYYPGWERGRLARETVNAGIRLDRLALQNCDRVIYSSHWARDSAVRDYGIEPAKLCVLPLGAGLTAEPSRADIDRWLARRLEGPCRLLFVGTDWDRKGGDIAIAVARALQDGGMPVELHVAGCDPPAPLPSFVRPHGYLSKRDVAEAAQLRRLFEDASFFILPSRAECFGLVFCEAAAYGLPAIATNTGGIPEILRGGDWGLMLPPTSPPDSFARWIRAARADPEHYARMAWAARRDFEQRLNWAAFCRGLVEIVHSVERERRQASKPLAHGGIPLELAAGPPP